MQRPSFLALCLLLVLGSATAPPAGARGDERPPPKLPAWAQVSAAQIEAARTLEVPVAFENAVGMRFVLIPKGTWTKARGAKDDAPAWRKTLQKIVVPACFYLQVTETTNAQYGTYDRSHVRRVTSNAAVKEDKLKLGGKQQPAVMMTPAAARAFARWLGKKDKQHRYRLPTEQEWEYACRAGTQTAFHFGDTLSIKQANFEPEPEKPPATKKDQRKARRKKVRSTVAVASFPPNAWGLHDMHGNAAEWCSDTADGGPIRVQVIRGGSFWDTAEHLRSDRQGVFPMKLGYPNIGLRLVAEIPKKR